MNKANESIPEQTEGQQIDVIEFFDAANTAEAHHVFLAVKSRLKDVTKWHEYAGLLSANFALTDSMGNEVYKFAEVGDLIRIDLPGPGSAAGGGYEWVRIEAMDDNTDEFTETEYITMTARPVANPKNPDKAIAHFFGHHSTVTFVIERYLNHISAAARGRNEVANTTNTGLFDTVRNTIIALSAREGLSLPQWKALMNGLLGK
ncbi:hypothetical protein [Mucilaginibacter glaciei]|uniref:Uncharacterized protein n=1 Tax=Mucilaginibacter glaciei TaxID=2772109 RepID=A0A926S3S9_9SPHI|nr:hypothetical protein [Mucilaginibacter glaciei]MBD1395232.1 hypothetical protein [Mucilaginibacter glaciei]